MLLGVLLTATLTLPSGDFRVRDEMLEHFHLSPEASPALQPQPVPRPFLWRALGWLNYAAAGSMTASQYYRQERSFGYTASPDNDAARISIIASSTYGANELSERLYESNREWAWIARVTSIGVLGYTAGNNFYNGWERR